MDNDNNNNILREDNLIKLLEDNKLICTGEQIFLSKQGRMEPLGTFVKVRGVYNLATPMGLVLFPAPKFHKIAQEKAKTVFLENLDKALNYEMAKPTLQ